MSAAVLCGPVLNSHTHIHTGVCARARSEFVIRAFPLVTPARAVGAPTVTEAPTHVFL